MIRRLWRGLGAKSSQVGPAGCRPWVVHPFLIAIFPIVSLYAHNVYETSPQAMVWPIALSVASTCVVWMALRLVTGDAVRAGLAASLLVASFFGFSGVERVCALAWYALGKLWVYHDPYANPLVVLAVVAVFDLVGIALIFRRLGRPDRWTRFLNVFTSVLVAMPTFGAISARLGQPAGAHRGATLPAGASRGWTPDIYYIILDGYARGDVMKEEFGFDNGPFLANLKRRGFFVAGQGTSNYCQTRLSLASTLNGEYLDKLVDPASPDLLPLTELIKDNLVLRSLRPLGYRSVSFSTGFDPTDLTGADVYLTDRRGHLEFSQLLLEMTPLDAWLSEVDHEDRYSALRDRTRFLLKRLPSVARMPGPTFTFAHLLIPHPPFVFGEHGEDVSPRRILPGVPHALQESGKFGTPEYFRDSYRDQSAYITDQVDKVVDQILADSPEPPVIILQADHGSWLRYHPDDVEATDLRERFGILNAIYAGGRKLEGLSDSMTSVNTFRALLKEILGADLPPLPDRNFFSAFHDPLHFIDVTERLHSPAERNRKFTYPTSYYGLEQQF